MFGPALGHVQSVRGCLHRRRITTHKQMLSPKSGIRQNSCFHSLLNDYLRDCDDSFLVAFPALKSNAATACIHRCVTDSAHEAVVLRINKMMRLTVSSQFVKNKITRHAFSSKTLRSTFHSAILGLT